MKVQYTYTSYFDCPEATQKSQSYNRAIARMAGVFFVAIAASVIYIFFGAKDYCSTGNPASFLYSVLANIGCMLFILFVFFGASALVESSCKCTVAKKKFSHLKKDELNGLIRQIKREGRSNAFDDMKIGGVYYFLALAALYSLALAIYGNTLFIIAFILFVGIIIAVAIMRYNYISLGDIFSKSKRSDTSKNETPASLSAADEIAKYKKLLDCGAITEEEYNAKKTELLGL